MQARLVVVVVVDRLGAGWLGPYGNTWLPTPHFDRLAAGSLLCETAIAAAPELEAAYRGYWSGRHPLEPNSPVELALLTCAAGLRTALVTDDESLGQHPLAAGFAEQRILAAKAPSRAARSAEETALFAWTAAAVETLSAITEPGLIWLHTRGLAGPWDAPLDYRNQLADADDPSPPQLVVPPEQVLAENFDPDELLGVTLAYAGQVVLLDECLGMLLAALEEHPLRDEALLIVTSPRGYPLGEHRRIGAADGALYAELLQVPLLVRFPQAAGALARSQLLVQPASIQATIAAALGLPLPAAMRALGIARLVAGEPLLRGDVAVAAGTHERAIRTPAWFLRESQDGEQLRRELFAKPDDRWELNEVASRCGEVPELLAVRLDEFTALARAGRLAEFPPLAEVLTAVWR